MELSRERSMHNTIDERIAETDLFCGNFHVETEILGCVLCLTATDVTNITQSGQFVVQVD